jgi:hypothetical protein
MTYMKPHFYRIEHQLTSWCPGQVLKIGLGENELTKNWRSQEAKPMDPRTLSGQFVNLQLIDFYNSIIKPENQTKTLAELNAIKYVLKETLKGLHDALLANREFAFESVRRERFHDKPSRMSCCFLIPDSVEGVEFWWKHLQSQGGSKRKLFRVAASGVTHRVNQDLLEPLRTCSIREWESKANEYWCDQASESLKDEVLFAGDLEVISEIDIGGFGLSKD